MVEKAISNFFRFFWIVILAPFWYLLLIILTGTHLVLIAIRDLSWAFAKVIRDFRDYLLTNMTDLS
jgi:hypothetical protein